MNARKSLSEFFTHTDRTTLDNCDSEPIHLSGMIQAGCGLVAVDATTHQVVAASDNIGDFLGADPDHMLTRTLRDVDADLAAEVALLAPDEQLLHDVLDFSVTRGDQVFDVLTHCHQGMRIIEFLPNHSPSPGAVRAKMRIASKTSAQIMHSADFDEALQITVDAVRRITGHARAKVYQFLPDWSGAVIAESRDDTLPSFLGLHFPAGDIPKQVREIMSIVPYRAIGTNEDAAHEILALNRFGAPIDLTWSVARSVSRMHTAYLRNMGVSAAFSCALMQHGKLWGMIAVHATEADCVPYDCWSLIHEVGASLMLRHDQCERTKIAEKISQLRRIENRFAAALRQSGDVEDVIRTLVPVLQEFLSADGFAFQYGANLHCSGSTPPPDVVREMIQWAIKQRETSDQFQSTAFHREFPLARAHMETACGVLIQPIATHRVCQLIWFRGPITRTVAWAGNPSGKALPVPDDPLAALAPRQSFAKWQEEHREESKPWLPAEMESAREIFKEFLDIVTAQLLLKDENASLKQFAASAAHDLKAPLRGINNALSFMFEDGFEPEAVRENHALAENYTKRLLDLTSGLLEMAVVADQKHYFTRVDLNDAAGAARELLTVQIEEAEAEVIIGTLPVIDGNAQLLARLFLNLIGNAIKFRAPDRAARIEIADLSTIPGQVRIGVRDTGIGIPVEHAGRVFQAMQRLQPQSRIEGSGLGLAICQRILEKHDGTIGIDTDYTGGTHIVFSLPAQHVEAQSA